MATIERFSGCLRHARGLVLHHVDEGGAERPIGLMCSQGGVFTWYRSASVRVGVV